MALINPPILTISIPTYNRSVFLNRNLEYLYKQMKDFGDQIELIVSDNASTDSTPHIVKSYQDKGLNINYIINEINRGADFNIAQCYKVAKGHFVYVIGDDDLLAENSLKYLLKLLINHKNAGVLYLESSILKEQEVYIFEEEKLKFVIYNSLKGFLHYVSYNITFISANIINRKLFDDIDVVKWEGSCVIQVPLILEAAIRGKYNIVVDSKILLAQADNSGGYNLYKVFGENFKNVIDYTLKGNYANFRNIILNDLNIRFFPFWVQRLKKDNKYIKDDYMLEIKRLNSYNLYFKMFAYPLLFMPDYLSNIYIYISKIYGFIRRKMFLKLHAK